MKSLFGQYNPLIDEGIHVALSALIAYIGYLFGLTFLESLFVFIAGLLIDIDHLLSSRIARLIKLKKYRGTVTSGSDGYTIKIFHGIDVAAIIGLLLYITTKDPMFGFYMFFSLSMHEIWDFIVYPHKANEILLATRMAHGFKPGIRKYFTGIIFDNKTLKF